MRFVFRPLPTLSAILSGAILCATVSAQGVDCSKPAPAVPDDWMTSTNGPSEITVKVDPNQVVEVRSHFGEVWVSYTFNAKDIKSVEEGGNDDGVVGVDINAMPFKYASSRGEASAPAGVTNVHIDLDAGVADQAVAGLKAIQQKAVCAAK
jgi:hypothetical protein